MGEDLPMVEPKPQPTKVTSAFRSEPAKDRIADYIPVGRMIKSSVLLSQESFFGSTAKDITEQPTIPVTVTDKGAGKQPVFRHKYYKTEDSFSLGRNKYKPTQTPCGQTSVQTEPRQSTQHPRSWLTSAQRQRDP
jgi:hypothetical protein